MKKPLRCAVYTRKSSEEGLEQSFNSLDAQREACEAYIKSQAHEGWRLLPDRYDDGGFSGGSMERPGLKRLLADLALRQVDVVVVYKVDRLTRSLADFARIIEVLDASGASFVSVTQQFNTTSSMGRLTLNVLLSFAQFEREVTAERTRDKIAASRRKGIWMGGCPPLGYDVINRKLVVNAPEAEQVRLIFERYIALRSVPLLAAELEARGITSKRWTSQTDRPRGGYVMGRGALGFLLKNRVYVGMAVHKGQAWPGEHEAIVPQPLWEAAQAILALNRHERDPRPRLTVRHLLTGMIFDDRGNIMSPSQASKQGRRWRYYVSRALLTGRKEQAGSARRIPAQAIEDLVQAQVLAALPLALRSDWQALDAAELPALVRGVLRRVTVAADRVTIVLLRPGDDEETELAIPVVLRTWGGERVIAGPDGRPLTDASRLDPALAKALARAHRWRDALDAGRAASLVELAAAESCTAAYVRRLLGLAFLAPDIVEMILKGRQSRRLTLAELLANDMPLDWREQRRLFLAAV